MGNKDNSIIMRLASVMCVCVYVSKFWVKRFKTSILESVLSHLNVLLIEMGSSFVICLTGEVLKISLRMRAALPHAATQVGDE